MKIGSVCSLLLICFATACSESEVQDSYVKNINVKPGYVRYYVDKQQEPVKALFLADCHITIEDERGSEFYQYTQRMGGGAVEEINYGKSNGREQALIVSLDRAKAQGVELVILGGDIINFPSMASVDLILKIVKESGLDWIFTAGNHDWHYEGEEGSSAKLREKWQKTNLAPLYQGANPMFTSKVVKGVNFVVIDNSTFEISQEQLGFMKREIDKGLPIVLSVHIPLYLPGYEDRVADYGCGNPNWNETNDDYYELERRRPWSEEGHTQVTYDFCDLVFSAKNMVGIYAGHTHVESVDFYKNIPQFVTGANFNGSDILIEFIPVQ